MQTRKGMQLYSASVIWGFLACRHLPALDLQHLVLFLRKVPRASAQGDHSHEVIDITLAKTAKSLVCIVASPGLTAVRCITPHKMSLVNGLCMAVRYGAVHRYA